MKDSFVKDEIITNVYGVEKNKSSISMAFGRRMVDLVGDTLPKALQTKYEICVAARFKFCVDILVWWGNKSLKNTGFSKFGA